MNQGQGQLHALSRHAGLHIWTEPLDQDICG